MCNGLFNHCLDFPVVPQFCKIIRFERETIAKFTSRYFILVGQQSHGQQFFHPCPDFSVVPYFGQIVCSEQDNIAKVHNQVLYSFRPMQFHSLAKLQILTVKFLQKFLSMFLFLQAHRAMDNGESNPSPDFPLILQFSQLDRFDRENIAKIDNKVFYSYRPKEPWTMVKFTLVRIFLQFCSLAKLTSLTNKILKMFTSRFFIPVGQKSHGQW